MSDCVSEPCFNAFIERHCHYSQMTSCTQRLSDLHQQADIQKINVVQQSHVGEPLDDEHLIQQHGVSEPLVDESTGWTTVNRSNSRTSRFIDNIMGAAQRSNEPSCGRVLESGAEQTPDNQSISVTSRPTDSSLKSGMTDVAQSVQCLGSIYHSGDSVRYFRHDTLTHTDVDLSVYDHNSSQHTNAVHEMIDTAFATCTPPATNKCQKRKGAKATKKLEQLESVGHELNPREATRFRALSARCTYLAQDRPDIAYSAKELCR